MAGAWSALSQELEGKLRDKALVAVTRGIQMTFAPVSVDGLGMMLAASCRHLECMKRERLLGRVGAVGAQRSWSYDFPSVGKNTYLVIRIHAFRTLQHSFGQPRRRSGQPPAEDRAVHIYF